MYHYELLPEHMREGVREYLEHGVEPGGFLQAIFRNDLVDAYAHADEVNAACMDLWAKFLWNWCPEPAWGSAEKMAAWMAARRADRAISP